MEILVLFVSGVTSVGLLIYSIHGGLVFFRFLRARIQRPAAPSRVMTLTRAPVLTTQIPICNDGPAAERILRAVAAMAYPAGCHEIQVLDDSSDDTRMAINRVAGELRRAGHRIVVVRRRDRKGGRIGALALGLQQAAGELIAVIDSHFIPPPEFLGRVVPLFLANTRLGFVQAAARRIEVAADPAFAADAQDSTSLAPAAREIWTGIPGNACHCVTVWRRDAIRDAGDWEPDTGAPDIDLSYRVQVRGWKGRHLAHAGVLVEQPASVIACEMAQVRWATGSIQVARKLLPRIWRAPLSLRARLAATLHLTEPAVYPLMLVGVLFAVPAAVSIDAIPAPLRPALIALIVSGLLAPHGLYLGLQWLLSPKWWRRVASFPAAACVGVGVAVANSRAVFAAMSRRATVVDLRPPQPGPLGARPGRPPSALLPWIEVAVGGYCTVGLGLYLSTGRLILAPLLFGYAVGFLITGVAGLHESYVERAARLHRLLGAGRRRALEATRLRGIRARPAA